MVRYGRFLNKLQFKINEDDKHNLPSTFFWQIQYKAEGKKEFNNYSIVTDTPIYVTAVLGHTWASEVMSYLIHIHIFAVLTLFQCWIMMSIIWVFSIYPQLIYREAYNKEKHLYTTCIDTFDLTRCSNLKHLSSTVCSSDHKSCPYCSCSCHFFHYCWTTVLFNVCCSYLTEWLYCRMEQDQGQELLDPTWLSRNGPC